MKYCPRCQREVGDTSHFCPQCGSELQEIPKNVGNETTKKRNTHRIWILLTFVFAVWGIVMTVLFIDVKSDYDEYVEYNIEVQDERELREDKAAFMDDCIRLVYDDGTEYYHTFECYEKHGGSFMAFNIEYAESMGYIPCPDCH